MKKCLKYLITIIFLAITFLLITNSKVYAEGSREIYDYNNVGSRINFKNTNTITTGCEDITIVYTYAKAGETIKYALAGNYVDITYPSGTKTTVTISQSNGAEGYIYNYEQERYKTYTPKVFVAPETGIYTFRLRPTKLQNGTEGNSDIKIREINDTTAFATNDYLIESWDISVYDNEGKELTGRSWLNYITGYVGWDGGNTGTYAQTNVNFKCYMLTPDGYTYLMDFSKVDPMGFVLFGSTRGVVNQENNTVLYHSYRATDSLMNSYYDLGTTHANSNIKIPSPGNGETKFDKYCKVFVSKPANDLPKSVKSDPIEAQITEDLKYIGTGENEGYTKSSGIFSFSVNNICNYTITIKNTANGDIVKTISNTALEGRNTVYWDGKDENGNYVSAGNFEATLNVRSGEYHFNLFDFEYIRDGITVTSEETGVTKLYHDDSYIGGDDNSEQYITKYPTTTSSFWGNECAVNLWTYTKLLESINFFLLDENPNEDFILSGLVFEDKDNSGTYNMYADSLLSDVRMTITNTDNGDVYHAITATNGMYYANVWGYSYY